MCVDLINVVEVKTYFLNLLIKQFHNLVIAKMNRGTK